MARKVTKVTKRTKASKRTKATKPTKPARPTPIRPPLPTGLPDNVAAARAALKEYAIVMYNTGETKLTVCETCGIGEDTLDLWRHEEGVVQVHAPPGHSRLDAYKDELREAWFKEEETLEVIARRFGAGPTQISMFARRMGWPYRNNSPKLRGRKRERRTHLFMDQIRAWWDEGLSIAEIGRRAGVSAPAITYLAKSRGWPARPRKSEEKVELVFQLWQDGLSLRAIARNLRISRGGLAHIVRRLGLKENEMEG